MKLYFLYSVKQLEKDLYTNAKDKQQIIKEINRRIHKKKLIK